MSDKFGLKSTYIDEINQIVASYPQVQQAYIFGSRATGTQQLASDVDLVIKGDKLDSGLIAEIRGRLERETMIPYFFDVVNYETIGNQKLKEHIDRVGQPLFSR